MEGYFCIYTSFYESVKGMSDDQLGRLFRALFEYQYDDDVSVDDDISIAFSFFKMQIDSDRVASTGSSKVSMDDINEVYKSYPSKCVVRGASSGKSLKNKDKIKQLLGKMSKEQLVGIINRYTKECLSTGTYMMNFKTFLNNLPDYSDDERSPSESVRRLVFWELDGKRQKSSIKDFRDTLQSRGKDRVKFIGYAD